MFFQLLALLAFILFGFGLTVFGFFIAKNKKITKAGIIIFFIAIAVVPIGASIESLYDSIKFKPTQKDLVGEYRISEVENLDFDKKTFNNYRLILKEDNTFKLTHTPYVDICDSGKYLIDSSFSGQNEISYQCGPGYIGGSLDRGLNSFRIEFIIGDPDSRQSIYFKKVESAK